MAEKMTVLNIRMSENEKEQIKEKGDKNKSVIETIKKFKIEEKAKLHGQMGASKGVER